MGDTSEGQLERFLKELMDLQRRYGTELKNSKTNRQEEVRELVDKFAARDGATDAD